DLPAIILEYRSLSKLKSTYLDALPAQINPVTNRVHTTYNQAVTATGRLSSSDPNLQNIPIRTSEGRKVRQAFIAPTGSKIVAADYSQIELRIMAYLSQDPNLLAAFAAHDDVHAATAAEVFAITAEQVTVAQRSKAKAINFGLIYGMSAFGLAKQLKVSRSEAQDYIDLYFARFPQVKAFMQQTRELAARDGYVSTIFGRKLYLTDINAKNGIRRKAAERAAINAPMQGSCADIVKRAMLDVAAWIKTENLPIKMLLQVHDEIVFEIPDALVASASDKIVNIMQDAAKEYLPLEVTVGVGINWSEAH
ncbi:MAG: DNA polymerase I, partial [Legionellales bacterium]